MSLEQSIVALAQAIENLNNTLQTPGNAWDHPLHRAVINPEDPNPDTAVQGVMRPHHEDSDPEPETETPKKPARSRKKAAAKAPEKPQEPRKPRKAAKAPGPSVDAVRLALKALSREQAVDLLDSYGCRRLSELKEADYQAVIDAAEEQAGD